jgi:hypothetical protein
MTWLIFYIALMLLPVIVLTILDGRALAARMRRRPPRRSDARPPEARRMRPWDRLQELEARWISIHAQFLVAPQAALKEADEMLTAIAQERGWLLPGENARAASLAVAAARALRRPGPVNPAASLDVGTASAREVMEYFDWLMERLMMSR